ncbi:hypothetical protein H4R19_006902 [Coemansia spiralis]|nr:hypothetical protein H4R19_006902 [Coemansia spiralis]
MQQAVGRAGSGRGDGRDTRVLSHGNRLRRGSIAASLPASDGVGEWDSEASAALAAASPAVPDTVPGDPVPDALRANFLEICKDKNSLEMFWQLAVRRYCNVWRTLQATQGPTCELPTNRPMTIDVLGDTLWQHRRTMPPAP